MSKPRRWIAPAWFGCLALAGALVACTSEGGSQPADEDEGAGAQGGAGRGGLAGTPATNGGASGGRAGEAGAGGRPMDASAGGALAGQTGAAGQSGGAGQGGAGGMLPEGDVIIDTHVHFWDPARPPPPGRDRPIPWPSAGDALYRAFMPADFRAIGTPLGIKGVVLVEASGWLEDNAWMLALAGREPLIVGVVGNLGEVLGKPGFPGAFEPLRKNPLFRGIRIGSGHAREAIAGGATRAHLEQVAAAGLAVDVLGVGAADVAALAASLPSLTIVVDHMAGVMSRAPSQGWRTDLAAMAKAPKVFLKISGLVEASGTAKAPADPAMYRAALDGALAAFGEDRLVYASNWPVSGSYAPLATVHDIVAAWLADKSPALRRKVYADNGRAAYGWQAR